MKNTFIIVLLSIALMGCGGVSKASAQLAQYRLKKANCEKIRAEMQALKLKIHTLPDVKKYQKRFKKLLHLTQTRCAR